MIHLVLWRVFSTVRRILVAPLLALVLGDLSVLPSLALTLTLGPLGAPLAAGGVLTFDWWVWYVVLVAWASDMTYFVYFVDSRDSWVDRLTDHLPSRGARTVATDGGEER